MKFCTIKTCAYSEMYNFIHFWEVHVPCFNIGTNIGRITSYTRWIKKYRLVQIKEHPQHRVLLSLLLDLKILQTSLDYTLPDYNMRSLIICGFNVKTWNAQLFIMVLQYQKLYTDLEYTRFFASNSGTPNYRVCRMIEGWM